MTDLTDFLRARIAEDEDAARTASGKQVGFSVAWTDVEVVRHLDRWTTPRVLAECDAKRQIVEDFEILHRDYRETHDPDTGARRFQAAVAVARLAAVYADHPEYDEWWRP